MSQRLVDNAVDVTPPRVRIGWWEVPPSFKQGGGVERLARQRTQFGDRPTASADDKGLTSLNAVDDSAAVVAKFADGDGVHGVSVSQVRQRLSLSPNLYLPASPLDLG